MEQAAPSISIAAHLDAGLGKLVSHSLAEFMTEQAVVVTHDHAALLEFGKVLHAESFEKFRSSFLVEADDCGTHHLQVAERKFGTDFATPARSTKAHLGGLLGGQCDLFHLFNQTHIRSGVEFRGLNLLPNLRNVFHNGSF